MIYGAQDVVPVDLSTADVTLTKMAYALRANGAGNIVVLTLAGIVRTLPFAAGETRYVYVQTIYKTNTTATGVEALLPPT